MCRALALSVSLACCLSALTVRAEDAPEPAAPTVHPTGPLPQASVGAAFSILVEIGDKARRRGRVNDAADAYFAALQLRNDATVRGRLGLIAALINEPVAAAADLLEAIERGGGATTKEKDEFYAAFKGVRPLVCNLHITGNVFDADVTIDNGKARHEIGATFKLFVTPGRHVVHGQSETRGEARDTVDCPKGGEGFAVLEWSTSASVPLIPFTAPGELHSAPRPPAHTSNPLTVAIVDQRIPRQEDPWGYPDPSAPGKRNANSGVRASVALGPIAVFGVASWAPAFGLTLSPALRLHEHFSIGLEGRGAWQTFGLSGRPIAAMTAGGLIHACGHIKSFFACASGHLGVVRTESFDERYLDRNTLMFKPGIGARIGAAIDISGPFALQFTADALILSSGTRVVAGDTVIADLPPILIGTSILPTWNF
jgi:hypothetical protein